MIKRYYNLGGIGGNTTSLIRAQQSGFDEIIKNLDSFGIIRRISTSQDDQGNYKEIKIIFV